ncbi:MAG: hypothetical protein ACE5JR_06570 [Gemmatimonadota bacterium]
MIDRETQPSREGGFALLVSLLVLVGLTALATAGFLLSDADYRVSGNHQASAYADQVANAGLYEYLGSQAPGTDTLTYAFTNGTATVWGEPFLSVAVGQTLYQITSVGTYAPPVGGVSTRTVRTIAIASPGLFSPLAAFTSSAGILKDGTSGIISGHDDATPADCPSAPAPSVAGVTVPPGGYTQSGGGGGGKKGGGKGEDLVPKGDPNIDDSKSGLQLLQDSGIDWEGIVDGTAVTPDYTIPPNSWPDFGSLPADEWPVIYIDNPSSVYEVEQTQATGPLNGRGTLIVRGDLTFTGNNNKDQWVQNNLDPLHWDGLILVGGAYRSNGYSEIEGALVTGLNLLLGESTNVSDLGNGNKTIKYNSCNVRDARQWMTSGPLQYSEMPGTWFESM